MPAAAAQRCGSSSGTAAPRASFVQHPVLYPTYLFSLHMINSAVMPEEVEGAYQVGCSIIGSSHALVGGKSSARRSPGGPQQ